MEHITPDPSFVRTLRGVDPKLGVKFNGRNFVVTYERPSGDPANIHTVKREDGGFRQPDQRDIDFIRAFDMQNESCRERLQRLSQRSEQIREHIRAQAKEEIRYATRDSKNQLAKAFLQATNQGKGNASFRRI